MLMVSMHISVQKIRVLVKRTRLLLNLVQVSVKHEIRTDGYKMLKLNADADKKQVELVNPYARQADAEGSISYF